jgi:hypothetical protein
MVTPLCGVWFFNPARSGLLLIHDCRTQASVNALFLGRPRLLATYNRRVDDLVPCLTSDERPKSRMIYNQQRLSIDRMRRN